MTSLAFLLYGSAVERFHKTLLDEFYRIAFRKKVYDTIGELQADLDLWIDDRTRPELIKAATASGKPPCRPSLTQPRSPATNRSVSPRTKPTPLDPLPSPHIVCQVK